MAIVFRNPRMQWYSSFLLCVSMWLLREVRVMKKFPHTWHWLVSMVTSVNNSQIKNIQQQFLKQQKDITERNQSLLGQSPTTQHLSFISTGLPSDSVRVRLIGFHVNTVKFLQIWSKEKCLGFFHTALGWFIFNSFQWNRLFHCGWRFSVEVHGLHRYWFLSVNEDS